MDASGNTVIAHLSDLHLGYGDSGGRLTPRGINQREMDGYIAWGYEVSSIINDGTIDVVLIAGDVFHTPTPSILAIQEAQSGIRRLVDAGIPVVILTGNHDTNDIRAELAATVILNDPTHGVHAHAEPYATYTINDDVKLHLVSHHIYGEQASTWDKVKPTEGMINVFSTHGSMIDPITKLSMHTNASPREVIIPDEIVNRPDWNYRLLGHIHERGFVGSKDGETDTASLRTYYNGSLIRRGFSDGVTCLGRGWTKWTITPSGVFIPEFMQVPQRPQVDYPIIDATTLSSAEITDIVYDRLTSTMQDNDITDETAPILRQRIINLTSDKRKAIDQPLLKKAAGQALSWKLAMKSLVENAQPSNQDEQADSDTHNEDSQSTGLTGGSVTTQFKNWLTDNEQYNNLNDSIRETVGKAAQKFMKLGQEAVLDQGMSE